MMLDDTKRTQMRETTERALRRGVRAGSVSQSMTFARDVCSPPFDALGYTWSRALQLVWKQLVAQSGVKGASVYFLEPTGNGITSRKFSAGTVAQLICGLLILYLFSAAVLAQAPEGHCHRKRNQSGHGPDSMATATHWRGGNFLGPNPAL